MNAKDGEHRHTKLTQVQLDVMCEKHETLRAGRPGGARASFSWCDLTGLSLRGRALSDADFSAAILADCDLRQAELDFCNLYCVDLQSADLSFASLRRADLRGACMRGANLSQSDLYEADLRQGALALPDRKLGLTFVEIAMHVSTAEMASLRGANLDHAKLSGLQAVKADFTDATMRACNLVRANLKQCIMDHVDLAGADLSGADLTGASLKDAVLIGAKTAMWRIHKTDLRGALTDKPAGIDVLSLPYAEMLADHALWVKTLGEQGQRSSFDMADLRGLGAIPALNLAAVSANGAVFYGLDMRGIHLQGAHLEGADLRCCDLRGADLRGARLRNARFDNANLSGARLGALSLDDGQTLACDLRHARMRRTDLSGADLRRAKMNGVDLSSAKIEGVLVEFDAIGHMRANSLLSRAA